MTDDRLVLGPLLRYVDETSAAIWVESAQPGAVTVHSGGRSWTARTFAVHEHHYALVEVDRLEPATIQEYTVDIDGVGVWPPADSPYPPSRIATFDPGKELRMLFGSCRTSVPHDAAGNRSHGIDAMRAYALHMASGDADKWPDLVVFLGDQVYADETSERMREFIMARRGLDDPPGEELKDYEEYAHLYNLAWSDQANRWLLSTLPSSMIFDDHDIRDDWNTSLTWRQEVAALEWWRDRIVGGLASYWVYQHLGNLSPTERADDQVWQHIRDAQAAGGEADISDFLDDLVERADEHPDCYRWSFARDLGDKRLIVVDSRAARVLQPDKRSILDDSEMQWFDEKLRGDFSHVFIGTSLPFLLSHGLHYLEAWSEAVASGGWGERAAGWGEKLRKAIDLEHWAAFQEGFSRVAEMVIEVADGKRGRAPATVTFLSGDVHHSYVSEVERSSGSRVLQAVCSPIRNPLPHSVRYVMAFSAYAVAAPLGSMACRSAKVPDPPFRWKNIQGPWFDNNIATLETDGPRLRIRWESGDVSAGDPANPRLTVVADVHIDDRPLSLT
ncbi:MAG: alkaline phosphatase family protein [Nocardioidaceae bacterium]|nr:alkaline phosphatase family protein [Nocardioidaceae bacterium]